MTEKKTIRVRRKRKCGTHTYMPPKGATTTDLITIRGGDIWNCPKEYVDKLDPAQWDFLDPADEEAIGGRSRRQPPPPKVGLKIEECPDQEGMFDVVNEKTGKRINNDLLTKEEADALIEEKG